MRFKTILPSPALAPYVVHFWSCESDPGEDAALPVVLPGTGAEIFFHYDRPLLASTRGTPKNSLPQAHLLCVRNSPIALDCNSRVGFVAIRFRAGMLPRFAAIPTADLLDQTPHVADLWGRGGAECADRVANAPDLNARIAVIQDFLIERLQLAEPDVLIENAVRALYYQQGETLRIEELASRAGISRRQLERRFKVMMGQTPVEFRRISRLQKTVKALVLDSTLSGVDAALLHGYFDQSHFINDFKRLVNDPPESYLKRAREREHFYSSVSVPIGQTALT